MNKQLNRLNSLNYVTLFKQITHERNNSWKKLIIRLTRLQVLDIQIRLKLFNKMASKERVLPKIKRNKTQMKWILWTKYPTINWIEVYELKRQASFQLIRCTVYAYWYMISVVAVSALCYLCFAYILFRSFRSNRIENVLI